MFHENASGSALLHLLEDRVYDLILCAGDDQTDESMYQLGLANLISIKVGDRQTIAQYRLPTPAAFRAFLRRCVEKWKKLSHRDTEDTEK